jgi:transcriptional regulator with AAA-type ATPase domain/tetratricopeptide (TPR) repeat protein
VDFATELRDLQHMIAAGKLESAGAKYKAIADRMGCSGGKEEQLLLGFLRAQILAGEDEYSAAIGLANELLGRFRDLNLRDRTAQCHRLLSGLLLRTGDYAGAKAHAEAAIYFCTWEIDDTALKGDAHNNLGLALKNLGAWEEAERHFRDAIDAYGSAEDALRNLRASLNLAILLRKMGKIAEGSDICKEGLQRSRDLEIPIGICRYALELANLSVIKRDIDEGHEYLRVAREAAEGNGYQRERVLALEIDGDLLDLKGDPDAALDTYELGLDLSRALARGGDLEAEFLRRAARVCLKKTKITSARHFVERALNLTAEAHDTYEYGVCLRILGELELAEGVEGCGIAHLEESVEALSKLSTWCHELALSEFVLGKTLVSRNGRHANGSAVNHLLVARRVYSNLGIGPAVRELDELIFSSLAAGPAGAEKQKAVGREAHALSRRMDPGHYGIVTEDERIVGDLERWGPTEARILIEGDTGVGKELMARALHAMSRRREGPFVAVDCGALSETLADSELFGHARGAFTGAMKDRIGLIEVANGGTVFLDEIGELSEVLQVKLLRVLEEGVVRRVGENVPRQIDVRVISATARDLWAEVEAGRFRRDLYYRLKTVLIRVPTLRERPYDIELLLDHYLHMYTEQHKAVAKLSGEARTELARYGWPGNVRELKNVVEALILSNTNGDLLQFLTNGSTGGLKARIAGLEREEIERVLKVCGGNKTDAAKMLGISRKTLWHKLKQMHIS